MKTTTQLLAIALASAGFLSLATVLQARTWTDAESGRTFDGDFVKMEGETATIRRTDGRTFEVPVERLSETDRAFIAEQAAAMAPLGSDSAAPTGGEGDAIILSGVHLCCGDCEKGIEKALADLEKIEFSVSRSADTVSVSGSSPSKIQAALDAIGEAGYYGESSSDAVVVASMPSDGDKETKSVIVSKLHLCCGKCIDAIDDAIDDVEGASKHTAEKGVKYFTVSGEGFTPAAVLEALQAQGLNATVRNTN